MQFIIIINVKMPTLVGILTFISMINTLSEIFKAKKNSIVFSILVFMSSLIFRLRLVGHKKVL